MPTISGDVATLLGADHNAGDPVALWLLASQPVLTDGSTGRTGGKIRVPVATNGTFTVSDVPATSGGFPTYQLQIDSRSLRRQGLRSGMTTGSFPLEVDRDLTWIVDNYVPVTVVTTQVYADVQAAAALGATNDTATASFVNNPASSTRAALDTTFGRGISVASFGAAGDGTTDDTAAIQAAIDAADPGTAIYFPETGSGAYYRITDTLRITTPNLRLLGQPRDGYAMSIRCSTSGKTMIEVKATGFVMQDVALWGDVSAINGVGATVAGLDLYGGTNGDVDCLVTGCTFQGLALGVLIRGRNATVERSLFSNSLAGVKLDGITAYHTGPAADQNRGNLIRANRFHNIGANGTYAALEVSTTAKILHAVIDGNWFDSNGGARHIVATGTSTNQHNRITFTNNKHTEVQVDCYTLTYVQNTTIRGAEIAGNTDATTYTATGIVLANCDTIVISDVFGLQLGRSGVSATSSNRIRVRDCVFRALGQDASATGDGLNFNSGNSQCRFDRVTVDSADGWGFNGSPSDSAMTDCEFRSCALGSINSTSLLNVGERGLNRYVEGLGGRKEDAASKPFDFTAGVATNVATVVAATNFTTYDVEVTVIGRNSAGPIYARSTRYIRPENGTHVTVTPIADHASGTVSVAFAALGTTGTTISATVTGSDGFATVYVRARAGGSFAGANRGVTVTMQ